MKKLKEKARFNCSANELWAILSDIGRCDWVPTIEEIVLDGDLRHFKMTGMGQITEKILKQDHASMTLCLLYTSPSPRDRTRSRMPSSA